MKNDDTMKRYTADELKARRAHSKTNWSKVDSLTDGALETLINDDESERGFTPDWTCAELILPSAKRAVNLRLEPDIIEFFKGQGRGHISKMQAVLKAYVEAHRSHTE